MKIKSSVFLKSATDNAHYPNSNLPEFAFIGRSNVGKSSLINCICNKKNLAKTSSKPGKTRTINFFLINNIFHLVDLPGYGYAKASKLERYKFNNATADYLENRKSLVHLFVLIDSNVKPQALDVEFLNWLIENNLKFSIVFTKSDKSSLVDSTKSLLINKFSYINPNPISQIEPVISSTKKRVGYSEILNFIGQELKL